MYASVVSLMPLVISLSAGWPSLPSNTVFHELDEGRLAKLKVKGSPRDAAMASDPPRRQSYLRLKPCRISSARKDLTICLTAADKGSFEDRAEFCKPIDAIFARWEAGRPYGHAFQQLSAWESAYQPWLRHATKPLKRTSVTPTQGRHMECPAGYKVEV